MADYKVTDTSLTSIADAIRAKNGTSAQLTYPEDFITAIGNIQTGGTAAIGIEDTADSAGGTVRTITALDISDTTATASDVLNSKYFYTAAGVKTQGTATATSNDGFNCPVFTMMIDESGDFSSVTCDKTYAEALAYYNTGTIYSTEAAIGHVIVIYQEQTAFDTNYPMFLLSTQNSTLTYYMYVGRYGAIPYYQINYASTGTITWSELPIPERDSTDLAASGDTVTVPAGYYASQASKAVASGTATAPATISSSSATISTGSGTLTLTKTVSVTPTVSAGYISSGTAGDSSVSLTASVTINPTPTASGDTVTIPAGYYASQTTKSVSTLTLPTSTSSSATSGYTSKATISRSTSDQYINIPTGYNSAGAYYKVSAVANGSATGPSSLSGSSATVSTGTNTLTLTKTGVTTTPTVSAGYVSSATASTATVTLTASVTTKAATTYHPSTSDQTIASGTYTTGTQTIKAVTISGLSASNIISGVTVKVGDSTDDDCVTSVAGSVVIQHYYTGSGTPSSSTGVNGDIYLKTS